MGVLSLETKPVYELLIQKSSTRLNVIDNTMAKKEVMALGNSSARAVKKNYIVQDKHREKVNILGLTGGKGRQILQQITDVRNLNSTEVGKEKDHGLQQDCCRIRRGNVLYLKLQV